jgi:myo-inositol-1(or 4)-monophosphatase
MSAWAREFDLAQGAARAAARLLADSFAADAGVRSREGKDIKTQADLVAEELILRALAPSGHPVIAEESATGAAVPAGPHWLVDPLDGTMNFSRGFPMHAVSIGLWEGNTPVLGVIADIARGSIYRGLVGHGAWRDDRPIRVSRVAERAQAVLATGFPTGRDYGDAALASFIPRVQSFKKIRMIGSAALSLAFVAEGVFEAYLEEGIMLWDVAAGLALVQAAGGAVVVQPGTRPHAVVASASNGRIAID